MAHLDFWGRRQDASAPSTDMLPPFWQLPPADTRRLMSRMFVPVSFQPTSGPPNGFLYQRPVLITLRYGQVHTPELFASLMGLDKDASHTK